MTFLSTRLFALMQPSRTIALAAILLVPFPIVEAHAEATWRDLIVAPESGALSRTPTTIPIPSPLFGSRNQLRDYLTRHALLYSGVN